MSFEAPMKMRWLSPKDKLAGSSQLKNPDIFGALYTLRTELNWMKSISIIKLCEIGAIDVRVL